MRRFGDGLAVDADLARAAEAATRQALEPLDGQRPDLVCVFASSADPVAVVDPDAVADLPERVLTGSGARHLIGCVAGGVMGGSRGVEDASAVSVWAGVLPGARLRTFSLEAVRANESLAVVGLPEPGDDDEVAVLLADPYSFPADGFVERSNDLLAGLPIVGGLAAGPFGPGSTRLFLDGRAVRRGAVGVLLGGPVAARPVVSQGCRPVGPTMVVTRAEGNVVLELAGTPALTKLEQIVAALDPGEQAMVSGGLLIGVAMNEYAEEHERGDFLIRGLLGADRDRDALVVGDLVEVGRTVRFQVRDAAAADEDLRQLLDRFRRESGLASVDGALLFSCNGRGASMFAPATFGGADHDVRAVHRLLAPSGVAGFFAAGEIGPVGGRNHLHGFTASILAFGSGGELRARGG